MSDHAETPTVYTWEQFVSAVQDLITVDAKRGGLGAYRPAILRQAVIDIQRGIDEYRINHETVYQPQDLVEEGQCSHGVKPPQSVIRDVQLIRIATDLSGKPLDTVPSPQNYWMAWPTVQGPTLAANIGGPFCFRYPTEPWPWADRQALINGRIPVNSGIAKFCVDPQGYKFYIYPRVYDGWLLSMWWDGLKLDFQDEDHTPFDEAMAGAVALFVKAHISREVDKDLPMYESYMKSYLLAKQGLYVSAREKKGMG